MLPLVTVVIRGPEGRRSALSGSPFRLFSWTWKETRLWSQFKEVRVNTRWLCCRGDI